MILENRLGHVDRGKDIGNQTNDQGDGKAADGARSEEAQEGGGNDGGDVRVDDGPEGIVETGIHRRGRGFAVADFFADPLKDQHVGVHAHADGKDDARDAREGQHGAK